MRATLQALHVLLSLVALGDRALGAARLEGKHGFDDASTRRNAPFIFNAVQDAMRQWGSSIHHNGMSFFLASVPAGALFHHGRAMRESPTDPDWLAYEIEHAEHFARRSRFGGPRPAPSRTKVVPISVPYRDDDEQISIYGSDTSPRQPAPEPEGGWLHVYRATRILQYLYVDGMGGGKTQMGTLDSQDYLLRGVRNDGKEHPLTGNAPGGPMDEQQRAIDLCKLCKEWKLDGVIRMEAGFEIIQCDFASGLEEVQVLQRPPPATNSKPDTSTGIEQFEFIRGLSERYQGIGASRTVIDYSSMVSAFFYKINITNPDPARPDLPRLSSAPDDDLAEIKEKLTEVIQRQRGSITQPIKVDWQGISDLIVGRYADRIQYVVKTNNIEVMRKELEFLLTVFIDYSTGEPSVSKAIERCTNFYLLGVVIETESDGMIRTAFEVVADKICRSLFHVRDMVMKDDTESVLYDASNVLQSLVAWLGWARYKRCPACGIDEVCMIPMWPMGTVEDYRNPRCVNSTSEEHGENYWGGFRRPGGRPGHEEPTRLVQTN